MDRRSFDLNYENNILFSDHELTAGVRARQEEYISRIVDSMDVKDLVQFAFDTLDEQMNEYTDEQLTEQVKEYYPDLLENV